MKTIKYVTDDYKHALITFNGNDMREYDEMENIIGTLDNCYAYDWLENEIIIYVSNKKEYNELASWFKKQF